MRINGREIGLTYNTGAHLDYNDWIVTHQKASLASAQAQRAVICNRAYIEDTAGSGEKPLTIEEIRKLPKYEFDELIEATEEAVKKGSEREVELAETKNAGSARKSS